MIYLEIPLYSEDMNDDGIYDIIGYSSEYVD